MSFYKFDALSSCFMQYVVPQFIEVEDKVIGPLTVRQFLIILAGGMVCAIGYSLFDTELFIFTSVVLLGVAAAFAFLEINGQKLEKYVTNVLYYTTHPKVRVWAKDISVAHEQVTNFEKRSVVLKSEGLEEVSKSKLRELALLLDTSARHYTAAAVETKEEHGGTK